MRKGLAKFDSMLDFLQQLEKPIDENNPSFNQGVSDDREAYRFEFTGTHSLKQAMQLATNGWPEGLKKIQRALDDIEALPAVEVLPVFDVCGEAFNLDAVLQGQPENMFYFMPQESNKPRVIQLGFNFSFGHSVSAESIIERGAAIASAVNDIEHTGIRVELYAFHATKKNGYHSSIFIKLKDADQPLELERVVFAAAHPSMLRRLWLRYAEQQEDWKKRYTETYGAPCDPKHEHFTEAGFDDQMIKVDSDTMQPDEVKRSIQQQLDSILKN